VDVHAGLARQAEGHLNLENSVQELCALASPEHGIARIDRAHIGHIADRLHLLGCRKLNTSWLKGETSSCFSFQRSSGGEGGRIRPPSPNEVNRCG